MAKSKKASPKPEKTASPHQAPVQIAETFPDDPKAYSTLYICFGVLSVCLVAILLFFSGMNYGGKRLYAHNILLLPAGAALALLSGFVKPSVPFLSRPSYGRFVFLAVCVSLSFLIQVIAVSNYFFITNWDVATVFKNCLYIISGQTDILSNAYFSAYPNNLLIVYLYTFLIRLNSIFAREMSMETAYLGLVIFHCALYQAAGVLLYQLTKKITANARTAAVAYILYFLLMLLSPWVTVPYSDSLGLIFPILILYSIFFWPEGKLSWLKWLVFALLTGIGYQIKPQIAIVSIAVVLIGFCRQLRLRGFKTRLKHIGLCAGGMAAGIAICLLLSLHVRQALPFELDSEASFGAPHYIMVGMNRETNGIYSAEDVEFSSQFSTKRERNAENLRVIRERIESMGWQGFFTHLVQKTLVNFNDGTFFWGGEGNFYARVPERNSTLSQFLQNVYYNQTGREAYYGLWSNFEHMVWLTILLFGGFAGFSARRREIGVVMLSLIGLTVFELIFEARARYMLVYTPLFILLASVGISDAQEKIHRAAAALRNKAPGKSNP